MAKDIKGYEGIYAVTENGEVWSYPKVRVNGGGANHNGLFIKISINHEGYYQTCLSKEGSKNTRPVHRLVAETYIPNPNNFPQVNHKDGNKLNNRFDNLEWCTNQENHIHAIKFGLLGRKLNHEKVKEIRERYRKGEKQWRIAEQYGVRQDLISRIVNFHIWKI